MKKNKLAENAKKTPIQDGAMDIKTASVLQLKAVAYDESLMLERCRMNIQAINAELASRQNKKG